MAGSTATIAYGYDELGRVTSRSVDGSTTDANNVSTTFDSLGRVTGVTNALGAFTYAYVDQTSRLSSVTYPTGTGLSTTYAYFNNVGDQRLQTIQNMSGTTQLSRFDYTYNPVGTIATWTQQADSSTAIVNTLSYDNADQLTSAVQSGGGSDSNAYNYDPAGNRLAEVTGSGTTAGQFNNVNQLTSLSNSASSQTVAGHTSAAITSASVNAVPATVTGGTNFSASVPLPPGTNTVSVVATPTTGAVTTKRYQIVTTGTAGTALTYDANGNTLTDENGNAYQWDALNRLSRITYPSGASSLFAYDGLSRRIQIIEKNSSSTVTSTKNDLWVGQEIAEERDTSNAVTNRFFPQGEQQAGTGYYYTRDQKGSIREMCGSSGTIISRMDYDSTGRVTIVSGTDLPQFQYANYYYDATSGLLGANGRFWDPTEGRWLNRDPQGEHGGVNLYLYCLNDPVNLFDPTGWAPTMDVTATPGDNNKGPMSQRMEVTAKGCGCKNVGFVQTVQVDNGPVRTDNPGNKPGDPLYHNLTGQGDGTATMTDWPGAGYQSGDSNTFYPSYHYFTGMDYHFETCAVCLDGGQKKIIGCRKWSLHWGPLGSSPSSTGQGTDQVPQPPTPEFHKQTGL